MRMRTALILSATALFALTGCNSGVRQALGVDKTTPDEFRVVTIAPLSDVTILVTDGDPSDPVVTAARAAGADVVLVPPSTNPGDTP